MSIHDEKRIDITKLSRKEFLLRTALDRGGWTIIEYEYLYGVFYYDVAIMYKGRRMLIDLNPGRSTGGRGATVKKIAHCKEQGQPLLIVNRGASTHQMQGQITAWLMTGG